MYRKNPHFPPHPENHDKSAKPIYFGTKLKGDVGKTYKYNTQPLIAACDMCGHSCGARVGAGAG